MLNFRQFLLIKEELDDYQRAHFNEMPRTKSSLEATDHYFGKENDVISKPLENTIDKSEVHGAIERHLKQEIAPEDYKAGVTTDGYNRKVKIGGILAKTNAHADLIKAFANDSTRQAKNAKGLTTVTTRSPGGDPSKGDKSGVAGQTSKNQSWAKQSCKNVSTGSRKRFLDNEIKHGTVVTYLHDHNGKEIARSTLQPHLNSSGETAYAVDSHYGINHAGFKAHAEQLAKELSKPSKNKSDKDSYIYHKHDKVYGNNGVDTILHPHTSDDDITDVLTRKTKGNSPLKTGQPYFNKATRMAAVIGTRARKHITIALDDPDPDIRQAAVKHQLVTPKHITKALDDPDPNVRQTAIGQRPVTVEHITKALNDSNPNVRRAAIGQRPVTPEHITKALDDPDPDVRSRAVWNSAATQSHIKKALYDPDRGVAVEAARVQMVRKHEFTWADLGPPF